jgi:hypothetical protein
MVKRKTQIPAKNQTLVVQSTDHHFTDWFILANGRLHMNV